MYVFMYRNYLSISVKGKYNYTDNYCLNQSALIPGRRNMTPKPQSIFTWDFWSSITLEPVELSCLMPNSCFIPLTVSKDTTLGEIKNTLWVKASKLPLSDLLNHNSCYAIQFINSLAATEEVDDENLRLCDFKPTCGVLRIVEKQGIKDCVKTQNAQISHLIGQDLKYFDTSDNAEINNFRVRICNITNNHAERKQNQTSIQRLLDRYPVRLALSPELPAWLSKRLKNKTQFPVKIKFEHSETVIIPTVENPTLPEDLVITALTTKAIAQKKFEFENSEDYILKVCGQQEYILGNHPLIQFTYIQETLARDTIPELIVVTFDKQASDLLDTSTSMTTAPIFIRNSSIRRNAVPSYRIHDSFSCRILALCNLNYDLSKSTEVVVRAGLFHGGRKLCEYCTTSAAIIAKGVARWEEDLVFPIEICNIPNNARLCFVVLEKTPFTKINGQNKIRELLSPRAWTNTPVFDYNARLKNYTIILQTWPYLHEPTNEYFLHPLGTVSQNVNTEHCIMMTVDFDRYNGRIPIEYVVDPDLRVSFASSDLTRTNMTNFEKQIIIIEQNPFYEMHVQDWKDLWSLRASLPHLAPKLLPKLLQAADWSKREDVACVHQLLLIWPKLPVENALELLDYAYPDCAVRTFAISCLQHISNEEISLYLLQLVQALKHESYLMCDLAVFLLNRAFSNITIGHFLFWHLKSELDSAQVSIRFQLMLEAYCRGCVYNLPILVQQVICLENLTEVSHIVRQVKDMDSTRTVLRSCLDERRYSNTIAKFTIMVNPRYHCKYIQPAKCRVMDSKMRPLLLVFENFDKHGEDIRIILKNGDDLRQDMFTLQMLRIMDRLWKNEGYDFRLNLYGCVSMGDRVGMIEVVKDAQTIANIQKEKGNLSPLQQGWLLNWLKSNNDGDEILDRAVSDFMWSCVGYCVATYVLGVGDRHSDNIMITKCGQLFHIDFGHILGNFKEKFGFRRERVPFVLAHEFVHVINRGHKQHSKEFGKFRQLCEEAFLILRRNATLIVSLFAMMISTGLPELNSEKDLQYLKETLALDCSEEEAKIHFHSKFDEALSNDWTTSLNWVVHNISRNNKT